MTTSALLRKLPAFLVICALGATGSHAFAEGKGNAKATGGKKIEAKKNHGREAGELPYGLEQQSEKKGELPSGLKKRKLKGSLPRGLEEGGKSLTSSGKGKKGDK